MTNKERVLAKFPTAYVKFCALKCVMIWVDGPEDTFLVLGTDFNDSPASAWADAAKRMEGK